MKPAAPARSPNPERRAALSATHLLRSTAAEHAALLARADAHLARGAVLLEALRAARAAAEAEVQP